MAPHVHHTPGPWAIDRYQIRSVDGWALASVPYALGDATDWANARLIAAAPDLLAALQGLAAAVEGLDGAPAMGPALLAARAAMQSAMISPPADLPLGSAVWYWLREEAGQWVSAAVIGRERKDGFDVYIVDAGEFGRRWGWVWQVIARKGETPPAPPDLALTWP